MRLALALVITTACTYDYIPEPRAPRTICMSSGYVAYGSYSGGAACSTMPADRCHPASASYEADMDSGWCDQWQRWRRDRNDETASREHRDLGIGLGVALAAVIVGLLALQ